MEGIAAPLYTPIVKGRRIGEPIYLPASRTGFMLTYSQLIENSLQISFSPELHENTSTLTLPYVDFLQLITKFEQIIKDVAGGMQFLLNSEVLSDYDKSDYKALLDSSLKFAVLTGCMRISKESIFTGLNNFTTFTIADVDFDEYFGFTDW